MSGLRRRNAVLETLELLRARDRTINLTQVTAYLYICENEGLSVSELAGLLFTSRATSSRVARSLAAREALDSLSPYLGVVEVSPSALGEPLKSIVLSGEGRSLRARIDAIIEQAAPIAAGF